MNKLLFILLTSLSSMGASIPMEDFFRDYAFDEIEISPDGSKVAALSMWKGNMNLYTIDLHSKRPTMLTGLRSMGVMGVQWVGNNRLIFTGIEEGYATGGLFAIDADGKNSIALSKSAAQSGGVYRDTSFLDSFADSETEILVTNNERSMYAPDVYRLNVYTGNKRMVARNPGKVMSWLADPNGNVRVGLGQDKRELFLCYREQSNGVFQRIKSWKMNDGDLDLISFDDQGRYIYVKSSMGRDKAAICLMDPLTGELVKVLFEDENFDAGGASFDWKKRLLGFRIERERACTEWVDKSMHTIQAMIDAELPGTQNSITSRSRDGKWIMILAHSDRDPGTFYIFNSEKLTLEKLVARAPWIKPEQMAELRPIVYTARDGLKIHGYLTLPVGVDPKNLPMVVNPHGGPWVRDSWRFNDEVQFLANRGYAVLQMNFRGSTGYGNNHLHAGYGEWGLKMQDDITDGVLWAIQQGYADPKRVAIYGASYGGFACMAGLAFTPDLYCCGVNYVGVTDIALLQKTIPEHWERLRENLEDKTGNRKTDRDRLDATSPLKNADKIKVPVFFAYGEQDERVDLKHGTRMASSLKSRGIPIEWMARVDEGHGYRRKENKHDFYRTMESFLAKYMGKNKVSDVTIGETKVIEMPAK